MTYPGVEVAGSDVGFEGGKSRSQHLKGAGVNWVLLIWVVFHIANDLTMKIHQVALERDNSQSNRVASFDA